MSKLPPRLMFLDSMHYGMKRVDFIAFALFPRVYKEIERLRSLNHELRMSNESMRNLLEDYTEYFKPKKDEEK